MLKKAVTEDIVHIATEYQKEENEAQLGLHLMIYVQTMITASEVNGGSPPWVEFHSCDMMSLQTCLKWLLIHIPLVNLHHSTIFIHHLE